MRRLSHFWPVQVPSTGITRCFVRLMMLSVLIVTTACSGVASAQQQPTATPIPKSANSTKPTYKVARGDITSQVQFSARIIPSKVEQLYFRTSGRVRKVYVRSGDVVKKGQVLADLVSLDQMETQAKQQELELRKAQINYEIAWLNQQLAATQMPNWDGQYDIQMKLQQYQVELAQIALDETKIQAQGLDTSIQDAQIISTMDGKVLDISVYDGSDATEYAPLITVGDDSELEIGATLNATQMQDLSEGLPAIIELPNRPGQKLTGKIRVLPYPYGSGGNGSGTSTTQATNSSDTSTRISLDNPQTARDFRLGELVQATVILESKQNVLWLPPQAIRTFESRNFVVARDENGIPSRVDVRLGIKNDEKVEILEGLQEGQIVVAP